MLNPQKNVLAFSKGITLRLITAGSPGAGINLWGVLVETAEHAEHAYLHRDALYSFSSPSTHQGPGKGYGLFFIPLFAPCCTAH